ncbi:unnamed protein product [Urochloa decumbens]|uniref:Uncharacterized protein n=1 Tax=Urochloa decumbens TaxID=240449 RepID=A0ABC9B277_9POAL
MKITVHSSKLVKPAYAAGSGATPSAGEAVPLTVFDKVNFDQYISSVNLFHPPAPPIAALENSLAMALATHRECAGRLGLDAAGRRHVILLNDAGARLVEATTDVALAPVSPLEPATLEVLSLHPSGGSGCVSELLMVQVTRFACGSFSVGTTVQHLISDGRGWRRFFVAWGKATRGAAVDAAAIVDRAAIFVPRNPPLVQLEHRGVEFKPRCEATGSVVNHGNSSDEVVVRRLQFSREMVSELKSMASSVGAPRPYYSSTLKCIVAHLWQCITRARGLRRGEVTALHLAVDGRSRMRSPPVPVGYTGNVVLLARPATTARELVAMPLQRVVELICREVSRIDESYFRSFIDFASSGAVEKEGLVPAADATEMVLCPDVEMDSILGMPVYELDFGAGPPFLYMPSHAGRGPRVHHAIWL